MAHKLLDEQLAKYAREPMKKGRPDWSLNSRNLIAACIFGPMGMPIPRGSKDKIPSIAAPVLEKFSHPFARLLIDFRSKANTVSSIASSVQHIRDSEAFGIPSNNGERRGRIVYNIVNYGNVERIFTAAEESIPISADKRVRYAIGDKNTLGVATQNLRPEVLALLPPEEIYPQGEIGV